MASSIERARFRKWMLGAAFAAALANLMATNAVAQCGGLPTPTHCISVTVNLGNSTLNPFTDNGSGPGNSVNVFKAGGPRADVVAWAFTAPNTDPWDFFVVFGSCSNPANTNVGPFQNSVFHVVTTASASTAPASVIDTTDDQCKYSVIAYDEKTQANPISLDPMIVVGNGHGVRGQGPVANPTMTMILEILGILVLGGVGGFLMKAKMARS